MDFFDDEEDDAPTSDQPTRESRRIREPEPEADAGEAADPEDAPTPRSRPSRSRSRGSRRRGRAGRSFDDDPVPATGGGGGGGRPSRQQIRSRQLTFLGVAIVVLILLFLAFKGCLNARKERAFKNYVSDLSALTVETKQLSDQLFGALNGKQENGDISLINEVNGDRGTAQGLVDRADNLNAPDQLASAQTQIALSYQLRRDALEVIATEIPNAQAKSSSKSKKAVDKIQEQMEVLLASDVLYKRARFEIETALQNEGIQVDNGVPESQFLPNLDYLDTNTIQAALSSAGASPGSAACNQAPNDGSIHGLELASTTAQPDGVVLQPSDTGQVNSVTASGAEFDVAVVNGGNSTESDIDVTLSGDFTGKQTISSIKAGETQTVKIAPKPTPKAGDTGTLKVSVAPVCGEQIKSNNQSTYDISFG